LEVKISEHFYWICIPCLNLFLSLGL
jgi:hypothetical protein